MSRFLLLFSFSISLVFGTGELFAQSGNTSVANGGSVYSSFGVGIPTDLETAGYKAQGILGITGINQDIYGLSNPALWGTSNFTQAISGANLSNYTIESQSQSGESTNLETTFLSVVFPVMKNKLGVAVSLYPVTRSSYSIQNTGQFASPDGSVNYTNELSSRGGVNRFEFGFGYRLNKNISFGYAPSVSFLSLTNSENLTFSSRLYSTQLQTETQSGVAFSQRFGIKLNFPKLLNERDALQFGATLTLPHVIGTQAELKTNKTFEGRPQEVDLSDQLAASGGDVGMPLEIGGGIGYAPTLATNISAEFLIQQWGETTNQLATSDNFELTNRIRAGIGGQYHPYRTRINSFFSRFKYSAGLSYDSGHLIVQGENIRTLWLNTGLGILSRGPSSIDLSFQYGFRGTTNSNLIEERIWTVGLTVNLAEFMFVRPKLR